MTKRTQLLLPTLLPLLCGVCVAACAKDSTPSDSESAAVSATGSTATPDTGATTSAPIGANAPTGSQTTGGGPTGAGPTGGAPTVGVPTGSGATVPTGPTGGLEGNGGMPGGTPSMIGSGDPGGTPTGSGGSAGNAGGSGSIPSGSPGTGGAGGSDPASGGAGGGGGTPQPAPDVLTVQLGEVKQIIRGFGVNATIMPDGESLPWEQLFTLEGENALGLSILRIGMHEEGGHRSVPSGWETARTLGAKIIGSCWSAPGDWKDNGKTVAGGHLLPARYTDWATRIAEYASEHNLYAMSIGNETDFASCATNPTGTEKGCSPPLTDQYESMVYTGKELTDFVKVAGPIFDEIAPDTKMIAPEGSLWVLVWSNLSPNGEGVEGGGYKSSDPLGCNCYSNDVNDTAAIATCDTKCTDGEEGYDYGHWLAKDEAAWNAFDILGVHEYETQVGIPWPADVTGGERTKEVWQTEMSGVKYWPEQGPSTDIANGVAVARWLHSALTIGEVSAWLYWWYESYYQNDNEGLAIVQGSNTIAKRYYALGNFSRFIRPDVFHAVQVAGPSPANVMVSAYKGDNDEVVIVAINETDQAVEVPITIAGGTAPTTMATWVTSAQDNLIAKDPVTLAGGVLTASLPPMTITSFVSE